MSKWLSKFLQDQKITKLARNIEASYIEHVSRLLEGKDKFSSIEDALKDFSERLGLSNSEMLTLKKKAMKKIAEQNKIRKIAQIKQKLETLKDEGITDPKAIRFMSNSKGKHNKDTASRFTLDEKDGDELVELIKQEKKEYGVDSKDQATQNNEFSTSLTSHIRNRIQKVAEEFGKVLPFEKPSFESVKLLQKELSPLESTTDAFKAARLAYNFTSLDGGQPKAGSPVKVKTYEYAPNLAPEVIKLMNENLRSQMTQEMNFDEWISFLTENTQEIPQSADTISKLKKMKSFIVGEKEYNIDTHSVDGSIKSFLEKLPQSFQKIVLRLISRGEYRQFIPVKEGKKRENIYRTGYQQSSFLLMDSFGLKKTVIPKFTSNATAVALAKKLDASGKTELSVEEFKDLLTSTDNKYVEKETGDEATKTWVVWGEGPSRRMEIKLLNSGNPSYKPLIPSKTPSSFDDRHDQMVGFQNKIADAVSEGLPLVYEPQQDGSSKPLSIHDLAKKKEDYTQSHIGSEEEGKVENKNMGVHPSYSIKGIATPQISKKDKKNQLPSWVPSPGKKEVTHNPVALDIGQADEDLGEDTFPTDKKSAIIKKTLQKLAEMGSWISDEGKAFTSEEQMTQSFSSQWFEHFEDQVVEILTKNLQKQLKSGQQSSNQEKEEKLVDKSTDMDKEEKLPLAAHIRTKLRQLKANKNPAIRNRIEKLIK